MGMMFSNKRPIVAQPAGRVPGMVNPMVINGTINGDLMVILWLKNGLTMVNNGMIWDLASGNDLHSY